MPKNQKHITRRDFIRGTVGATLSASILGANWTVGYSLPGRSSRVAIIRDKNVMDASLRVDEVVLKNMLAQTVIQVTGAKNAKDAWLTLFKTNDTIGLVPTPHLNPTHEELITAVKNALVEAGIPMKQILILKRGVEEPKPCTALIALPGLKAHWLTGIGTVLKNYIMYSGNPSRYHGEDNAKLGEIWNLPDIKGKTKLILVDALYPLCDKGPQPDPRYKWQYKGLIAGTDPVAVETVCLKIITEKRKALRGELWPISPPPLCVEAADKVYGLGTSKMEEIKIESVGWKEELLVG